MASAEWRGHTPRHPPLFYCITSLAHLSSLRFRGSPRRGVGFAGYTNGDYFLAPLAQPVFKRFPTPAWTAGVDAPRSLRSYRRDIRSRILLVGCSKASRTSIDLLLGGRRNIPIRGHAVHDRLLL